MRLLKFNDRGALGITKDLQEDIPRYAILSHTWGDDEDEVTFDDVINGSGKSKAGYTKIRFCGDRAKKDDLEYFWVDTCCINKASHTELSEAITSMFRWYRDAHKCYVYLSDVSVSNVNNSLTKRTWKQAFSKSKWSRQGRTLHQPVPTLAEFSSPKGERLSEESALKQAFRGSRWFNRGWTLQELIAPTSVEFFSQEGERLGSKYTLEQLIHTITGIPTTALDGAPLSQFSVDERMQWAAKRETKKKEDKAYCLLGIFDVFMPLIYGEGDNAFMRLNKEIYQSSRSISSKHRNVHWTVGHSASTLFTGREDILRRLEATVRAAVQGESRPSQCRMVIAGMGGQGKSEICLQLAQRVRPQLWGVFWVDVSTRSMAENGFLDIASRLQIPTSAWEHGRQGLATVQQPWMLVLDNADDLNIDYQDYFPPSSSGVVVLTSRNDACRQYTTANFVALEGLPIDEARELLLKAADIPYDQHLTLDDDARGVATLLQSHPLALIQAGAYVARGHCTLAEYPRVYERHRQRLLGFRPSQAQSRYRDVYATFEASVEMLHTSHTEVAQDALQLLPLLAVGASSRLSLRLFEAAWKGAQGTPARASDQENDLRLTQWHVSRLPSLMQATADSWDPFRLVEAAHALKALAIVSTEMRNGHVSVSMHPLVHAWARDRQNEQQQHESWVGMGCTVAFSRRGGDLLRVDARALQPHVQAMTSWDMHCMFLEEPTAMIVCALAGGGWLLHGMRDDRTLFMLLERLCAWLGIEQLRVDVRWIELYDLIGRNLNNNGQVKEAVTMLEEVVWIRRQTQAEDHPDRLASQHALAGAYEANGQVKDAVSLLEHVVKIQEQTLAEDHPDRLASQHALAGAYRANGQVQEAVSLLEQVVKIQEQTLGEDHPDRLASRHALAVAYLVDGRAKEAASLLEQVVRIQELILAEDHPSRLASQHTLAKAYRANGQVKEAVSLLEQVVRTRELTLAEDHPDRLASQHKLAGVYEVNGQVKDAVSLLEHVVRIQERTLAEDHPSRLASQHTLAIAYRANGQVKEAVSLLEPVVKIREQTLAEDHPDRLASQHTLAIVYKANGQVKEAVLLLEQVVQIQEQILAEDHPDRLASQHTLAGVYRADGRVKEAVSLLEQVDKIQEQTLGEGHPDQLESRHSKMRRARMPPRPPDPDTMD